MLGTQPTHGRAETRPPQGGWHLLIAAALLAAILFPTPINANGLLGVSRFELINLERLPEPAPLVREGRQYCAFTREEFFKGTLALRTRFRVPKPCGATILALADTEPGQPTARPASATRWSPSQRQVEVLPVTSASPLSAAFTDLGAALSSGALDAFLPEPVSESAFAECVDASSPKREVWSEKHFAPRVRYLLIVPASSAGCSAPRLQRTLVVTDKARPDIENYRGIFRQSTSRAPYPKKLFERSPLPPSTPWVEATARVTFLVGTPEQACSAVLLDSNHVVTAGHCLTEPKCVVPDKSKLQSPRINQEACESISVDFLFWRSRLQARQTVSIGISGFHYIEDLDAAILRLSRPLTEFISPDRVQALLEPRIWKGPVDELIGRDVLLAGYPGGNYLHVSLEGCRVFYGSTQVQGWRHPPPSTQHFYVSHTCDAAEGNSGGPLLDATGNLIAIHLQVVNSIGSAEIELPEALDGERSALSLLSCTGSAGFSSRCLEDGVESHHSVALQDIFTAVCDRDRKDPFCLPFNSRNLTRFLSCESGACR